MALAKTIKNNVEMSWEKVRLGDVAKLVTGKTPPTNNSEYFNGEYIWVNPSDFGTKYITNSKRTLTSKAVNEKKCNLLPANSILLSCIGDIGKVGILKSEGTSNQQITALISNSKIHPDFLYYYLMYKKSEIEDLANKAVVAILNNERLKELLIPLPPLATQKRIADILDTADALRRKDQELLTKYDQLAQAIFIDMFGDPVKNEKGWEVKKLGEHIDSIRYGTGSPPEYSTFGIPFIRATNIKKGTVVEKGMVYLSDIEAQKIKKCFIKEGDLIIVRSGANTGDCAYIPAKYNGSLGGYDLIVEMDKIKSRFYNYIINSIWGKSIIEKLSRRAGQPHLNSEQVSNMELISPDYVHLQKFKKSLDAIDELKINIEKIATENSSLFSSLIQQAFNGTLVS
jgi:type I restriction enzyme S subunit